MIQVPKYPTLPEVLDLTGEEAAEWKAEAEMSPEHLEIVERMKQGQINDDDFLAELGISLMDGMTLE